MFSTSQKLTRNEINQDMLIQLQQSIEMVIVNYKKTHDSFWDEYTYSNTFGILNKIQVDIQNIIQSSVQNKKSETPFVKYVAVLDYLYSVFGALDAELELNLIFQFQAILIDQLRLLTDADWEEKKRGENYKDNDLDGRIYYCLSCLHKASSYASTMEQSFQNKWQVSKSMQKYTVWLHLLENFNKQLGEGRLTSFLLELRQCFGLPEMKLGTGINAKTQSDLDIDTKPAIGVEKIVQEAQKEIQALQITNSCTAFDTEQKKLVDTLNNNSVDFDLGLNKKGKNEKNEVKELRKARLLMKNIDKFDNKIKSMLINLKIEDDQTYLDDMQLQQFSIIKDELAFQLKLFDLNVLINDIKKLPLSSMTNMQKLINEIKNGKSKNDKSIFSENLQLQVKALKEELLIFTPENLKFVCHDYFKECVEIGYNENTKRYDKPHTYLAEKFIDPLVKDVINPLRYILGVTTIEIKLSDLIQELTEDYASCLPVTVSVKPASDTKENHTAQSHVTDQQKQAEAAIRYYSKSTAVIGNNAALRMALSAAYDYLNTIKGNSHGGHGEEAGILFINNILNLKDKSLENIQKEAFDFVNGKGKNGEYGTWYGGASGYHKHSRIAFITDSGLFDNLKGVIFPYKTSQKNRFFDHQNQGAFSKLDDENRKDFTKRVSLLGGSVSIPKNS